MKEQPLSNSDQHVLYQHDSAMLDQIDVGPQHSELLTLVNYELFRDHSLFMARGKESKLRVVLKIFRNSKNGQQKLFAQFRVGRNFYRPRSKGVNAFGSVHPSVSLFCCGRSPV